MDIKILKLTQDSIKEMGISQWPIWEKEVSSFSWLYEDTEECFFTEGKVTVEIDDGRQFNIGKGDFVVFPKGLSCKWNIIEPVRKHYRFR